MKIIVDKDIPYIKGVLESRADVQYLAGNEIANKHLKDADALLIRTRTICNEELLNQTKIKFIGTATIGYDHIDTDYCKRNHIVWKNAPGCNALSVNQYVASALARMASRYRFSLSTCPIGIVGVGNVGSQIQRTAELLGMPVYLCDPPRVEKEGLCGFISLEGIIRESRIITFHVPLQTRGPYRTDHLINKELISSMHADTLIINTSRGEVADTESLKQALKNKSIKALVADVWEHEPHIDRQLLSAADIATPHIAGYSADGKANGTTMVVRALSRFFNLGLQDWKPKAIALPKNPEIKINCNRMTEEEILCQAILGTYDVSEDDERLRTNPDHFEQLRSEYPVRREFHAFTLKLDGSWAAIERRCRRMGFRVQT